VITYLLFIAGFFVLIYGADWLVEGASAIAKKFQVSDLVIGLTIVSFGTSAPELVVAILASAEGRSEIVIGNVLGSNIFNTLMILGISAIIYPLTVQRNTIWKEIPLSLLAALLVAITANDVLIDGALTSVISRSDGLMLLSFFIIFIYYTFNISRKNLDPLLETPVEDISLLKSIMLVFAGLAGLVFGGRWIVDGAVEMATSFGVSETIISLTIISIGTSLPELATSAVAAYKKNADIAIGNVVGSNLFNIFLILGVGATVRPLPFNLESNIDVALTIFSSALLFAFMFTGKGRKVEKPEGIIFVVIYVVFVGYRIWSQ
jgi:cation:H+ antiporter